MNVLSLFDGISCGRVALDRAGIKINKYYASEIDKYAIKIAQKNYPDTIQIGDVTEIKKEDLPNIDLLIGGSPCQGFSFAGKQLNFKDPRSALFFEFVRLLKDLKPKYFLLENVRMKQEYQDIISEQLGVNPIAINSNLVSAQNRNRSYWTNIPNIAQPEDRKILLENVIDDSLPYDKGYKKYNPYNTKNYVQFDVSGKGYKSQQDRAYFIKNKFGCFPNARAITKRKITDGGGYYRNLTLNECEELQTLLADYTFLESGFSLNKSLSALGNGWTVEVIAHIFKNMEA